MTNKDTNVATNTVTNDTGNYSMLYLQPGAYTVTAELQGFRKMTRENVEVRLGDRLEIDFKLEVGRMEEVVTVAAETPLLDTRSGSAGQVIDEKRIALMPLSDGNPFVLARLAPGVAYHGDLKFSRPFDNGGTSDFTADGGPGRNEFTLDGSPNMANGRRVAFVPPAGAVQEFKVETATFDAQQGHTAGRDGQRDAEERHQPAQGRRLLPLPRRGAVGERLLPRARGSPEGRRSSTSATGSPLGGPALLGKLYDGRDRTFFFTAFEWLYDQFPEPGQFTVPTAGAAQRRLLGAAVAGDRDLRPADRRRAAPNGRVAAPAVPGQHHSAEPHQPDRAAST